jgi:asparaginyl-tRNA synthetase
MLWRAQRIYQCSSLCSRPLSWLLAPAASFPRARAAPSRTFVSALPQRQEDDVVRRVPSRSHTLKVSDPLIDTTKAIPISQLFNPHLLSNFHSTEVASEHEIRVVGLVQSIRKQKKAAFAQISDGSTLALLQAVLSPEDAAGITNGAFVSLMGVWQKSLGKGQSHELQVRRVEAIGASDPEQNPIQKQYQTREYLRSVPHLRLRVPFHSLVARARSTLIGILIEQFMQNAVQVHPPIITSSDCEGAGEVFTISPQTAPSSTPAEKEASPYFRESKYLTVSSQLHLEAYAAELGPVFALSPTFRAEESDTPRHLSEFYMLEAEYRSVQRLQYLLLLVSRRLSSVVKTFQETLAAKELLHYYADHKTPGSDDVIDLNSRWTKLMTGHESYRQIWHSNAVRLLLDADTASHGTLFKTTPSYTTGLQLEHERWIVENVGEGLPVFVTHYPKSAKPFYMLPSNAQSSSPQEYSVSGVETVACFDLLLPYNYGEVAGGSLREHRLEELIASMRERGMLKARGPTNSKKPKDSQLYPFLQPDEDLGNMRWYADLRRFGSSPHGGFGLGFDRLLAYLVGVSNVRDVVAFPRTFGRADC